MIEKTLAKRYAAALLKVTDAEGSTEETESLLLALRQVYLSQKPFRAVLAQPRIPRKTKKALLHKLFEGRARQSFIDFLDLLVDRDRQDVLPDIAEMFDRLADATKGIVRVKARSWRPLSSAQQGTLQQKLEKITGKKIEIETQVDPAVKGGLSVTIGDTIIDGSVANRLKNIAEKLRELERR